MIGLLLAFKKDEPSIDVSAHADLVTDLLLYIVALLIGFFVVRPELWRRIFLRRIDPRPAAIMRIVFLFVVLWTFLDLAFLRAPDGSLSFHFLFTDEGLWLTDMARRNYGGDLKTLWDPEQGFEQWWHVFKAFWGRASILHFRSDPPFVAAIYGTMMFTLTCAILGWRTRMMTIVSWFLVEQLYRYSPVYYTGGDTVTRCFMFLAIFQDWGQAYSIDAWRKRRKAILGGATTVPPLKKIAQWPSVLMWLQLAIIYSATGLLKSGATWANGSALYYALNLDHFYRFPITGIVGAAHFSGILPAMSILVHWWEMLFPVVLVGLCINAYERERQDGTWPKVHIARRVLSWLVFLTAWAMGAHIAGVAAHYYLFPDNPAPYNIPREQLIPIVRAIALAIPPVAWGLYMVIRRFVPPLFNFIRSWVLGRRFWLFVGFNMHIGIDTSMNVGVFANIMMAVYPVWLAGKEIEGFWRYLFSAPTPIEDRPTQEERLEVLSEKVRKRLPKKLVAAVFFVLRRGGLDRLYYRQPGPTYTIYHRDNEESIRYAALLRCWDVGNRLRFVAEDGEDGEQTGRGPLKLQIEGSKDTLTGAAAGRALLKIFPGLWVFRPFRWLPVVGLKLGGLTLKILRQK